MKCAWKELLMILPPQLRSQVDKIGKDTLQELRMRVNAPPELVLQNGTQFLIEKTMQTDLDYVINAASRFSPWTAATLAQGYLTAQGGHRIGICGEYQCQNGQPAVIRKVRSLCIRVAREYPGIADQIPYRNASVLILGAPGWGKTTLLRDLITRCAQENRVSVVDERKELFPDGCSWGTQIDILSGYPKSLGIEQVLRTMAPQYIAIDEITAEEDCRAVVQAANCGVRFLATAHAASFRDFSERALYRVLANQGIFQIVVVLNKEKSYTWERVMV